MTIGATLGDQIYKEGKSTWGCKSGVLDVEDVIVFIDKIKQYHKENSGAEFGVLWDKIELEAGKKLTLITGSEEKGE